MIRFETVCKEKKSKLLYYSIPQIFTVGSKKKILTDVQFWLEWFLL